MKVEVVNGHQRKRFGDLPFPCPFVLEMLKGEKCDFAGYSFWIKVSENHALDRGMRHKAELALDTEVLEVIPEKIEVRIL